MAKETRAAVVPGTRLHCTRRTPAFTVLQIVHLTFSLLLETQLHRVDPKVFAAQTLVSGVGRKGASSPV